MKLLNWAKLNKPKATIICLAVIVVLVGIGFAISHATTTTNEPPSIVVYVTATGSKYHRINCRYLNNSKIEITLDKAKLKYTPCSVCKPPKQ